MGPESRLNRHEPCGNSHCLRMLYVAGMHAALALAAPAADAQDRAATDASCAAIPLIRYESDLSDSPAAGCESLRFWNSRVALGGEVRARYENLHNSGFGADPEDENGAWLVRMAAHADLRIGTQLRVFTELQSALESGHSPEPGPLDENRLEFQNAFAELALAQTGDRDILLRIGRQELQLGSARLISVRDGPNVRRTFDGARLIAHTDRWILNALAAQPRKDVPGTFDDSTDDDKSIWGLYATRAISSTDHTGVDLYYLGYRNNAATFDQGTASERRHTLGARLFGTRDGWSWNWEPMIQFGQFGSGDLRAWTLASETSYTWRNVRLQPQLTLSANIASGDRDPADPDLETFNPLFPRGNYFSEDSILGPQNFYNAHLFATLQPSPTWSLTADYDWYWRLSTRDGVYGPSGRLVRSAGTSDARFVATALSLTSEWVVGPKWKVTAIYTHLRPQSFLRQTGPSEPVDFIELTARLRF